MEGLSEVLSWAAIIFVSLGLYRQWKYKENSYAVIFWALAFFIQATKYFIP